MALILHLETATEVCSVAVSNESSVLASEEAAEGYRHSEYLHTFIIRVLTKASVKVEDINAVSISAGPGSYTGLRIGSASAKGLCFALNIPLIAINTLECYAAGAIEQIKDPQGYYCPMIDARRMEVYMGLYDYSLCRIKEPSAVILGKGIFSGIEKKIYCFGSGSAKWKVIAPSGDLFAWPFLLLKAEYQHRLAHKKYKAGQFEKLDQFQPFYLKNFISGVPGKKLL